MDRNVWFSEICYTANLDLGVINRFQEWTNVAQVTKMRPVATLFAVRKKHEKLHGDFLQEALKNNDPAPEMEKSFASDYDALKKKLDEIFREKEDPLFQALNDETRVKETLHREYGNKRVTIEVPYAKNKHTTLFLYLYNFKQYED